MVGHLKVSPCKLAAPQKASYWLSYCSLCDALRKNQGLPAALLLSNELTLLLLAFDDHIPKNGAKTACVYGQPPQTLEIFGVFAGSQTRNLCAFASNCT